MGSAANSMTSRPSTAAPILAALAIGLVVLGVYVGGYLWLGRLKSGWIYSGPAAPDVVREFDREILVNMYWPATRVESWIRSKNVQAWSKRG